MVETLKASLSTCRLTPWSPASVPDAVNNPLSVERAKSVRDYLTTRGIDTGRIETVGRGEREPVADTSSDAGRAKNRRVEIFLREPAPA